MAKRVVTDRKLVAASKALLDLADCADIDARLEAHWEKTAQRFYMESGGYVIPTHDEPPRHGYELVKMAACFSQIVHPDEPT